MPRIFIAVPVSDVVRDALAVLESESRPHVRALRWVAPHLYHITLKFLGEIAETEVEGVRGAVEEAVRGRMWPIRLHARGLGAFPRAEGARAVWVGVTGDGGALQQIHANIEEQLATLGFPREKRPFTPHITVARSRRAEPLPPSLRRYAEHDFGHWTVDRIQIVESHLSAAGPRYVVRHEIG